jgi:hypothetical protein
MPRQIWLQTLTLATVLGLPAVSHALDVHLQNLPPAPGLNPSQPLGPLDGVTNALSCGLDFLNTAKPCGLSAPTEAASPFTVNFDPLFCRFTLRFSIGELIDGLLKNWLAGAFSRLDTPAIGALCLLGMGPPYCHSPSAMALPQSVVIPQSRLLNKASPPTGASAAPQKSLQDALNEATRESPPPTTVPALPDSKTLSPSSARDPADATGLDTLIR